MCLLTQIAHNPGHRSPLRHQHSAEESPRKTAWKALRKGMPWWCLEAISGCGQQRLDAGQLLIDHSPVSCVNRGALTLFTGTVQKAKGVVVSGLVQSASSHGPADRRCLIPEVDVGFCEG